MEEIHEYPEIKQFCDLRNGKRNERATKYFQRQKLIGGIGYSVTSSVIAISFFWFKISWRNVECQWIVDCEWTRNDGWR